MSKYLLFLLFPVSLLAQSETESPLLQEEALADTIYVSNAFEEEDYEYVREPYSPPPLEPLAMREVPEDQWDKATGATDYSKDVPKPPKERKQRETNIPEPSLNWTGMFQGLGTVFQALAVLLALALIAYGVYWMMQAPRNRIIARDGTEITLANLDEYIHETDLERFLREAITAGNWTLAVRIYFLQIIKNLSEQGAIAWSKEKTNRDYIRDMRSHRMHAEFRDVVRHYERVWYGNQQLDAAAFAQLEPVFKRMLGINT